LNTYTHIAKKVAIFAQRNSKIASLMSAQRSDLRKTLKCESALKAWHQMKIIKDSYVLLAL